jgi:hypothetical protein
MQQQDPKLQGGYAPMPTHSLLQLYKQILGDVKNPDGEIINRLTELAQQLHSTQANEVA